MAGTSSQINKRSNKPIMVNLRIGQDMVRLLLTPEQAKRLFSGWQ